MVGANDTASCFTIHVWSSPWSSPHVVLGELAMIWTMSSTESETCLINVVKLAELFEDGSKESSVPRRCSVESQNLRILSAKRCWIYLLDKSYKHKMIKQHFLKHQEGSWPSWIVDLDFWIILLFLNYEFSILASLVIFLFFLFVSTCCVLRRRWLDHQSNVMLTNASQHILQHAHKL